MVYNGLFGLIVPRIDNAANTNNADSITICTMNKAPIPLHSALVMRLDAKGVYRSLPVTRGRRAGTYRDVPIHSTGVVRSRALPGFSLDLGAFFRALP